MVDFGKMVLPRRGSRPRSWNTKQAIAGGCVQACNAFVSIQRNTGGSAMRSGLTSLAIAMLATTAFVEAAQAQSSYPCANDLPNPYHQVQNWAQTPRPWAPANAITVDSKNNLWVVDRCEDKGCGASNVA